MKLFQILLCLFPLHRLRLIDDQDRVRLRNDIDRSARTKFVRLHVNPSGILPPCVERLGIDDHNIDRTVRGKTVNLCQTGRIIDKEPYLFAIFLCKMLLSHLQGSIYPFTDRNARDNDYEFAPPVSPVQLIHRLNISVRLSDPRLHLNRKVIPGTSSFQPV